MIKYAKSNHIRKNIAVARFCLFSDCPKLKIPIRNQKGKTITPAGMSDRKKVFLISLSLI